MSKCPATKIDFWELAKLIQSGQQNPDLVVNNKVFVGLLDAYEQHPDVDGLVDALNNLSEDLNLSPGDVKGLLDQHTVDRIEVDARRLNLMKGKSKTRKLT